jgi:predicted O-methyltransferase YrrM
MPRTFRHWSPRYLVNRLAVAYHQRVAPNDPWLTKTACAFLDDWLTDADVGLEWGCGRSTLWFAARVRHLTSVEHNPQWHSLVRSRLAERGVTNVELRLVPTGGMSRDGRDAYVDVGSDFEPGSLDFVLVDGQFRSRCAAAALTLLKPGGIMIIDNAEWFIPHASHSPGAIARRGTDVAADWRTVVEEVRQWRSVWTSNGVWDTAIYCRPLALKAAMPRSNDS